MRKLQKEKHLLNSLYIYDVKTSANPTKIKDEELKYEFTFVNRLLDNDYEETEFNYGIEEEYAFDTFIITKDSYLIKIEGVRQKANYATKECPKIKLKDIDSVYHTMEYLLNYCVNDRDISGPININEKVVTNYDYVRTCIQEMLSENLKKEDFDLVFSDINNDVKEVIANRLENTYLNEVTYINLIENGRQLDISKKDALELKNNFLITYIGINNISEFNNYYENTVFKFIRNFGYHKEMFTELINKNLLTNIENNKEQFRGIFNECFLEVVSIGKTALNNNIVCGIMLDYIFIEMIANTDDDCLKYYFIDFKNSKDYLEIKNSAIDLILNTLD